MFCSLTLRTGSGAGVDILSLVSPHIIVSGLYQSRELKMQKIQNPATMIRDPAEINTIRDTGESEEVCVSGAVMMKKEVIFISNRRPRSGAEDPDSSYNQQKTTSSSCRDPHYQTDWDWRRRMRVKERQSLKVNASVCSTTEDRDQVLSFWSSSFLLQLASQILAFIAEYQFLMHHEVLHLHTGVMSRSLSRRNGMKCSECCQSTIWLVMQSES